jgi:hypothetical protein
MTLEEAPGRFVDMELADDERAMPAPAPRPAPARARAARGIEADGAMADALQAIGYADRGSGGGKRADKGGFGSKAEPAMVGGAPAGAEVAVREWFPEAFLWKPSVQTADDGVAELDVRVPDQLTTWRVLALAHDRTGHQAGTTHTFDSTLPAYIDPVEPGWMYVGDTLRMPVQVVNNRADPLASQVTVRLGQAASGEDAGTVAIGPYGSAVRTVTLLGETAGTASLSARLEGVDAVEKTWPVRPSGRPTTEQRGGVLRGTRSVSLTWPEGADPRTAEIAITVHPGPLAVLTSELERIEGGRSSGAYAYGLARNLQRLASASGADVDEEQLRTLRIRAWQRLVRASRSPSGGEAADLLLGLGSDIPEDETLIAGLRNRLVNTLVSDQRGDGTWARQSTAPLQQVLLQTAIALSSLRGTSQTGPILRAHGAIERNLPNIDDPYTAAAMLAVTDSASVRSTLEPIVLEGLVEVDDGSRKTVAIPADVRSAWGNRPSRVEALAWTALALQDSEPEVAGDLVAELMTHYSAERGFGSGPADALALEAVLKALPTVDSPVRLVLRVDGKEVAQGAVDPKQPRVPAVLSASAGDLADGTALELVAEPATVGLSFVVDQRAWLPWTGTEALAGVDVEIAQSPLRAGEEGTLTFTLAAPSQTPVTVTQGLPSGMAVDADALKATAGVVSADVQQDRFTFTTSPQTAGAILEIPVKVTPTYAGAMISRPLELEARGQSARLPPHRWVVR